MPTFNSCVLRQLLRFFFEALVLVLDLGLQALVGLKHFLDLVLVFVFNHFDQSVLIVFVLILYAVSSLLQLLKGDFKLALRLDQVLLIILFLVLQELALALPQSLVLVIHRLQV